VTHSDNHDIEFEVHNPIDENELIYLGYINYKQESTELFYEYNPQLVNVNPKEISSAYNIREDSIEKTYASGSYLYNSEYIKFKDYIPMIQTIYSHENEIKIYELADFIIIEGRFQTYKMYQTNYGYKIEEYRGDHQRKEIPYSDDNYLTSVHYGVDWLVFDLTPIQLEYNQQPIICLNPMLKYVIDENK